MHVKAEATPHHMTFMKLKANDADESEATPKASDNKIETSAASLTYTGQSDSGAS